MKVAQRVAQKSSAVPELWARCLLGHCYGLWFLYLPTHVRAAPAKLRALQLAYDVLRKMEQHKVVLPDEVRPILLQIHPGQGELLLGGSRAWRGCGGVSGAVSSAQDRGTMGMEQREEGVENR
ncbi:hypothetical protein TURU_038288 [Turdus rufiventris]|nr:hypothetical protein TURU_038288 [Turdus rufiventris]